MPEDYIPSNDGELIEFADNFISRINGKEESLGLVAADTTELAGFRSTFNISYLDNNSTQMAAQGTRKKKDTDRKPLLAKLREAAQILQVNPNVTDAQRAELGLKIRETSSVPTGPPESRPVLEIDTSEPLRHTIKFYDNELETRGKPEGVKGAEIWGKIGGEATMNEEDYRYLGTDTASPYLAVHKAENIGKQAHYISRWVNARGEYGAWSNPETATITG